MAKRADGLDLSKTFIIVDCFAIKNTRALRTYNLVRAYYGLIISQDYGPACS